MYAKYNQNIVFAFIRFILLFDFFDLQFFVHFLVGLFYFILYYSYIFITIYIIQLHYSTNYSNSISSISIYIFEQRFGGFEFVLFIISNFTNTIDWSDMFY